MNTHAHRHVLLALFLAACSAGTSSMNDSPGIAWDAGWKRSGGASAVWGGAMASGGLPSSLGFDGGGVVDASGVKGDAGKDATLPVTLGTDATVFTWDGLSPRSGGAAIGVGGSTASSGGITGMAGSTVVVASGGISRSGGINSAAGGFAPVGGQSSMGGVLARGGSPVDAGLVFDAFPAMGGAASVMDASRDLPPPTHSDGGVLDGNRLDANPSCTTRIRGVVPVSLVQLVAGVDRQIVLRAEVTNGTTSGRLWNWWGTLGNTSLAATNTGVIDPALASFPIVREGRYTFSVADHTNQCRASISVDVFPPDACPECNRVAMVQAAPPVSSGLPIQNGPVRLLGLPPYADTQIVLARGVGVKVAPSIGSDVVVSYVRILDGQGTTRADGVADQKSPFTTRLLGMNSLGQILRYHVLVVPLDGRDGGTIGATAPQLFANLSPDEINDTAFRLADGLAVTGSVSGSAGNPIADARVVLTNQDPNAVVDSPKLLFSSVGKSDAQGIYRVHVQPGSYWPAVTPPAGVGYAEAVALSSVTMVEGTQISFRWGAPGLTTVKLTIQNSNGTALAGARVRVSTAKPREVGQFTLRSSTGSESLLPGYGNVTVEATTSSSGEVEFAHLPVDTEYTVLMAPAPLGPFNTTTLATLAVSTGSVSKVLRTMAETPLKGQLKAPAESRVTDWSRVLLWAYDRSTHDPEIPRSTVVGSDGSFSLGVTPGRPYVLIAIPPADSLLARTFVGPGVLQATEFAIVQRMATRMEWASQVMDENQSALGGTAVQIFCEASWPLCVDATIPIAETTAAADGSFRLGLPDPASR